MTGLQRICKLYGAINVRANGENTRWVWDYATDKAVPERMMPMGGKRWIASERAKYLGRKKALKADSIASIRPCPPDRDAMFWRQDEEARRS